MRSRFAAVPALAIAGAALVAGIPGEADTARPAARPDTDSVCAGLPNACYDGLAYWDQPIPIPTYVTIGPTGSDDYAGYASILGGVCKVTIRPDHAERWQIYAHEFGHCKGLHHDEAGDVDRPGYRGVMSYDFMYSRHKVQAHDHEWEDETR